MNNLSFLFTAYVIIWTVLFFYLLYLNKRQRELGDKIKSLSESLQDRKQ